MAKKDESEYLNLSRNKDFEKRISEATEALVLEMANLGTHEVKLRYITHIFAKTLDEAASWIDKKNFLN